MCQGTVTVQDGVRGSMTMVPLTNTKEQMQNLTLRQMKEKVASEVPWIRGKTDIRLVFKGQMLAADSTTLSQRGIKHEAVILALPRT
ncbi:hypothetical protein INR49_025502 [Caranx melampygus]|nr:hypothetical protein INR49_025502 [Caranx melampygus]